MSRVEVDKIDPQSGTSLEIGSSGDTINVPSGAILDINSGATLTNNGTATGFAAIAWQSVVTAATLTAVAGRGYPINTTSNACTVTLPAAASVGDQIIFTDYARNWGTNALTINQNSLKYQGYATPNPVYDTAGESVNIVYMDATKGWVPINDGAVAFETAQIYTVDFLVIGGGGAGGYDQGGAGGAGGYRTSTGTSGGPTPITETALTLNIGTTYTATIGTGGVGVSTNAAAAESGLDTTLSGSDITDVVSAGGGGAGVYDFTVGSAKQDGRAGGSGGGGGGYVGTGGAGTANQGNTGGTASTGAGGGGGGASSVGTNAVASTSGGNGGAGLTSTITGSGVARGGGGGGGTSGHTSGTATDGGGAGTSSTAVAAGVGTANTGGGGGGSWTVQAGGDGGTGVVILSMPDANYSGTTTGSPTVATGVSGKTILTFTGDGTYTA